MKLIPCNRSALVPRAFTLIELMVVVAIIGVLAALLLPTIGRAKMKAKSSQCQSNLRQLHLGWMGYTSDHADELPTNSDEDTAGKNAEHPSWVAGWLRTASEIGDHRDNTDRSNLVDPKFIPFGSIGGEIRGADVYQCPSDRSGRVRSVSMNAYLNGSGRWRDTNYLTFRQLTEVRDPSSTWVFMDEREDSINDGYFAVPMGEKFGIIDYPASYHGNAGNLAFADGHVEAHKWLETTTSPPFQPGVHLPGGVKKTSSTDRDMSWLTVRTTTLRQKR